MSGGRGRRQAGTRADSAAKAAPQAHQVPPSVHTGTHTADIAVMKPVTHVTRFDSPPRRMHQRRESPPIDVTGGLEYGAEWYRAASLWFHCIPFRIKYIYCTTYTRICPIECMNTFNTVQSVYSGHRDLPVAHVHQQTVRLRRVAMARHHCPMYTVRTLRTDLTCVRPALAVSCPAESLDLHPSASRTPDRSFLQRYQAL